MNYLIGYVLVNYYKTVLTTDSETTDSEINLSEPVVLQGEMMSRRAVT